MTREAVIASFIAKNQSKVSASRDAEEVDSVPNKKTWNFTDTNSNKFLINNITE